MNVDKTHYSIFVFILINCDIGKSTSDVFPKWPITRDRPSHFLVFSPILSSKMFRSRKCYVFTYWMLLDGFILLESFVTPAGISMGIKLRTEFFFPILWVIRLHWYRKFVKMYSFYNPDVSFAVSEICLKSAVLDHGSNRSSG